MAQTYRNSIEEAKAAAEKLTKERLKEALKAKQREEDAEDAEVVDSKKSDSKK